MTAQPARKMEQAPTSQEDGKDTAFVPEAVPYVAVWPEPDPRYLRGVLPKAPSLPLAEVLGPRLAAWTRQAAEAKSAPADYVLAALLAAAGALIGNARWVSPWAGWTEPPVIWAMCIGLPSAGKSPAIDAVQAPLRQLEKGLRQAAEVEIAAWNDKDEKAKLVLATWKEQAKTALKEGQEIPERPAGADAGKAPIIPRLVINDVTIERLCLILSNQQRGILQMRDELSGWLEGMVRYSGGGSDRPFWLEAYGGRGYSVERVGRPPLTVGQLTIGVLGGIQPDRLKTLLFKADDDGLLARILPIWPDPVPVKRPGAWGEEALIDRLLSRLLTLEMVKEEPGECRPRIIGFSVEAQGLMDDFRQCARDWETEAEGLLLSFIGKLPGTAARLALILAFLDWAAEDCDPPNEITVEHFGRAAHLVEAYLLPMARRAYADASLPKQERAAVRLVSIIREKGWRTFSSRDVQRLERAGLRTPADISQALTALEEGDCIRLLASPPSERGGRPSKLYTVNPAIHGRSA